MNPLKHPLVQRGDRVMEEVYIWTIKQHPHRVIGVRRGLEVRIYRDDAWDDPYLVSMTMQDGGHVMDLSVAPSAAAAEAEAYEMLAALDGVLPSTREH
jgi:hypothetical protein